MKKQLVAIALALALAATVAVAAQPVPQGAGYADNFSYLKSLRAQRDDARG
ncbi:hypothetical protein [Burkholderia savannae]|uniref:hypothetical protein n=1 Tax=Burkholderia savannae TaxID=1637837 RepID=UPI0012F4BE79|nr:hypothetical protein [Burkholderia savannae]